MARFPTVAALASASPGDVLRQWSGLGYNRRALNLQRTARAIVERHGGRVPDDLAALEALPGVGPYTARAVAAIAFGQPVGPVDTNVRRVLGRVATGHGSSHDPGEAMPARQLQALADALVPEARPADWTAALMDIGATLCRPTAARLCCLPAGGGVPVRCGARGNGVCCRACAPSPSGAGAGCPRSNSSRGRASDALRNVEPLAARPDHGPPERRAGRRLAGHRGARRVAWAGCRCCGARGTSVRRAGRDRRRGPLAAAGRLILGPSSARPIGGRMAWP